MAFPTAQRIIALVFTAIAAAPVNAQAPEQLRHGHAVLVEGETRTVIDKAKFDFWIRKDHEWTKREIEVTAGKFEVLFPEGFAWGMPGPIDVDGRLGWTTLGVDTAWTSGEMDMEVRWVKPAMLRVVDGRTGAEFEDIELVRRVNMIDAPPPVDRKDTLPVGEHLKSPLEIPFFETNEQYAFNHGAVGIETYWVRAPGMAWNRIRIDPTFGGERILALWPAIVSVKDNQNWPVPVRFVAQSARKDEPPVSLSWSRYAWVAPLTPGAWQLQVRRANGEELGEVLTQVPFDVEAGVSYVFDNQSCSYLHDRVLASMGPPIPSARRNVAVELRIPTEWTAWAETVEFAPINRYGRTIPGAHTFSFTPLEVRAASGVARLELKDIECGSWRVRVAPLAWSDTFAVSSDSPATIATQVGERSEVSLRIIDGDTGAPVDAQVKFDSGPKPAAYIGQYDRWTPAKGIGEFKLDVPAGSLCVMASATDDLPQTIQNFAILSGKTNALVLRMYRWLSVPVEAFDGEARIPSDEISVEALAVDSPEAGVEYWLSSDSYRIALGKPGHWRFTCSPIDGYAVPEPIEVDVRRDAIPKVAFHLKRLPR
jgi:hypothetical protein